MIPIVDVKTMRDSDFATITEETSGRELMLRAGQGILSACTWQGKTAIVCGEGNNAGDGYVLAMLLWDRKKDVILIRLGDRLSKDGEYYYKCCSERGVPCVFYTEEINLSAYDTIVDCIYGTGFYGEPTGLVAHAIHAINQSGAYVVSADINSGLHGDNGMGDICVRSDLTVSIGSYKAGLFLGRAKDVIGARCNVDIGIHIPPPTVFLAEQTDFKEILGERRATSHKGDYGYVTVLGGSVEYAGAAKLANLSASALRVGCGVAQLAVPESIVQAVSPFLLESTLLPIPSDDSGHMSYCPEILDSVIARQAAIAVGMGWGNGKDHAAILAHLLEKGDCPLVIDADGLNTLSKMDLTCLQRTSHTVVLTPHLKEFERLSGVSMSEIVREPLRHTIAFARQYGVILLLKGACTVITDGHRTILVDRGCAGMATAGSGDVLSGILVGLLGYHDARLETVACGAYIAGLAGELAQSELNPISMLASDTVSHIAMAVSQMI